MYRLLLSFKDPEARCSKRNQKYNQISAGVLSAQQSKWTHFLTTNRVAANAATTVASILAADAGRQTTREVARIHLLRIVLLC